MILSSEYKWKITLQSPVKVDSEYGTAQTVTYVDSIIDIYAKKVDIGGNKTMVNYELFTSNILQFDLRYRTDFDESYRVKYNNRYYEIINIKEKEFHSVITITCNLCQ
jgi:head-tail adaptor